MSEDDLAQLLAETESADMASRDGDHSRVLDEQLAERTEELVWAAVEGDGDEQAIRMMLAAGNFRLARYEALGETEAGQAELDRGLELFCWLLIKAPMVLSHGIAQAILHGEIDAPPAELAGIGGGGVAFAMNSGDTALLARAVEILGAVVDNDHLDASERFDCLLNLGGGLGTLYEAERDPEDSDRGIAYLRTAKDLVPAGTPERRHVVLNLVNSLVLRARVTRQVEYLDAADAEVAGGDVDEDTIALVRNERELMAPGVRVERPDPAGLVEHSRKFRERFERTRDLDALEEAVAAARSAAESYVDGSPEHTAALAEVATTLRLRFEHRRDVRDLMTAVSTARVAAERTVEPDEDTAELLSSLGAALQIRFQELGRAGDLDEAITAGEASVAAYPPDSPRSSSSVNNVGNAYRHRFQLAGDPADLDEAIRLARKAVGLSWLGHPNLSSYLSNLSIVLQLHSELHDEPAELHDALHVAARAVQLSGPDVGMHQRALSTLAIGTRMLLERAEDESLTAENALLNEVFAPLSQQDADTVQEWLGGE